MHDDEGSSSVSETVPSLFPDSKMHVCLIGLWLDDYVTDQPIISLCLKVQPIVYYCIFLKVVNVLNCVLNDKNYIQGQTHPLSESENIKIQ